MEKNLPGGRDNSLLHIEKNSGNCKGKSALHLPRQMSASQSILRIAPARRKFLLAALLYSD
jgi:hypothetical protein